MKEAAQKDNPQKRNEAMISADMYLVLDVHSFLLGLQRRLLLSEMLSAKSVSRQRFLDQPCDLALLRVLLSADEKSEKTTARNVRIDTALLD